MCKIFVLIMWILCAWRAHFQIHVKINILSDKARKSKFNGFIFNNIIILYWHFQPNRDPILYSMFTIKIINKNPLKLMKLMTWPISSNTFMKKSFSLSRILFSKIYIYPYHCDILICRSLCGRVFKVIDFWP